MLLNVVTVGHEGREKDGQSSESTRLPPMWRGFKCRRRRIVGSLRRSERFFGFPASLQKPTLLN